MRTEAACIPGGSVPCGWESESSSYFLCKLVVLRRRCRAGEDGMDKGTPKATTLKFGPK